jgi:PASTA domain/Glucodextranase, domain B
MRAFTVAAVLALAALAPGCGEDPEPPRTEPGVKLELGSPSDGAVVRSETVEIRGTVLPRGASVKVLGREVAVDGGSFRAEVPLEPGANLIDVSAEGRGRRPDFAVARIVREVRLPVPDVTGSDADNAQEQLEGLGLTVLREDTGGFFDPLLPGDPKVCEQEPRAGTQVLPGSEVVLLVARDC